MTAPKDSSGLGQAAAPEYAALLDFVEHGVVALHWVGPDGTILWANRAELELLGYTREEYVGRNIADFHADREAIDDILARLTAGEVLRNYPARLLSKSGETKDVLISSSVRRENDQFIHTRCFTVDVTDRIRAEADARRQAERLALLSDAGELLAASLDYAATLESVAHLAVPALADWCIVDVVEGEGVDRTAGHGGARAPRINRVAVAAASPEKQAALEELRRRYTPAWDSPQPAAQALRTGKSVLFPTFTEEAIARTVRDEPHHTLLRALAPTSGLAVPLVARGRTLGAISLAWAESGRHYDEADLRFAEELARRCALAVDNARLYREAREGEATQALLNTALRQTAEARDRALAEAGTARERLAFLAEASERLAGSLDYETTLREVARLAVPGLADWCAVDVLGQGGTVRRLAVAHADEAKVALAEELGRRYPPDPGAPRGAPAVLRTGLAELYPEVSDDVLASVARDAEHLALLRQVGLVSAMVVPMTARGRTLGALTLAWAESGRRYDEADLAAADDLSRRAALAVDNARLYRAAQAERARMRDLFLQAPAFIAVLRGPNHVYELVNPPYLRLVGRRDAAELLGRPVREALPELVAQGYIDLLDQVFRGEEPWVGRELPVQLDRRGDGTLEDAFVDVVLQPYRTADGRVDGIMAHGVDVTEQVRARQRIEELAEQVRSERALLEAVLQQMPAGVIIAEAPSGRLLLGNRQVELIWRHPFLAAAGVGDYTAYRGFHPEDGRPYAPDEWPLARAIATGQPVEEEIEFLRGDQTRGTMLVRAAPVRGAEGEIVAGVVAFLDITTQKEAEAALRGAIRMRDDFLAAASHDLKNPLASVRGTAQTLRRTLDRTGTLPADRLALALDSLQRSADRMTGQIDELLDVARLRLGQPLPLDRRPADLVALARDAVALQQATTERHRVRLDSREPALVGEWDAPRLSRVLANLLSNAVKYSPGGGDVVVTVTRGSDRTGGTGGAPWAVVRVRDSGIGIPAADRARIFERFERAANVAGRIEGTGIGLATAKQVVEQHGGTLSVESVEGQGSTFTLRLPIAPPPAPQ